MQCWVLAGPIFLVYDGGQNGQIAVFDFLTQLVREMWAETKAARTGMNVHDSNLRKAMSVSEPSASEVVSDAQHSMKLADVEDEVTGGGLAQKLTTKKVVKFPTMIDDGGQSTRSRGRYSPPPSPTRTNSGRTGEDTSKDTASVRRRGRYATTFILSHDTPIHKNSGGVQSESPA